ncbi:hypothetical protein SALWKB29_1809 [Snodgrassella communis]|uniref:Uncharacterized protein n=1 Tax=Snodgrassella communis TaxID=2946699 RepID=A0A836MNI3_9NEIS|nr:hypothetical protein SALWKB29_1809 [Snodgrassella communis]
MGADKAGTACYQNGHKLSVMIFEQNKVITRNQAAVRHLFSLATSIKNTCASSIL